MLRFRVLLAVSLLSVTGYSQQQQAVSRTPLPTLPRGYEFADESSYLSSSNLDAIQPDPEPPKPKGDICDVIAPDSPTQGQREMVATPKRATTSRKDSG